MFQSIVVMQRKKGQSLYNIGWNSRQREKEHHTLAGLTYYMFARQLDGVTLRVLACDSLPWSSTESGLQRRVLTVVDRRSWRSGWLLGVTLLHDPPVVECTVIETYTQYFIPFICQVLLELYHTGTIWPLSREELFCFQLKYCKL